MASLEHVYPETRRRFESAQRDPRLARVRGGIFPRSTCRSQSEQARLRSLYLSNPRRYPLAAPVGTSPHQIGAIWGDEWCHAIDEGFVGGNPPYGNIRTRPRGVARHPDWALLEDVNRDHGLERTVASEEWHYQLAGSRKLYIPGVPQSGEDDMFSDNDRKTLEATRTGVMMGVAHMVETRKYLTVLQRDIGDRIARVMKAIRAGDEAELEKLMQEFAELDRQLDEQNKNLEEELDRILAGGE